MVSIKPLAALVDDIAALRRDMAHDLARDLIDIERVVRTRGDTLLLVDFPAACKLLDAALSGTEGVPYEKLPEGLKRKGPDGSWEARYFTQLWREVDQWWKYYERPDANLVFFLRQLHLLYKKYVKPCPPSNVDEAILDFLRIEADMRCPECDWDSDEPLTQPRRLDEKLRCDSGYSYDVYLLKVVQDVADLVFSEIPVFDPMQVVPRHGPGAVADVKTGLDKYQFDNWPSKLSRVFDEHTFAKYSYNAEGAGQLRNHEVPAKLIAVPKTYKTPRLIAAEPVAHQFLQQGLRRWFVDNPSTVLCRSIDYRSQERNQTAALWASSEAASLRPLATVDLSSASDRLSCWLVESIFRKRLDILQALHAVRTRWLQYSFAAGDTTTQYIKLRKYANQGSAVTFVLQSMVYAVLCISAVCVARDVHRMSLKRLRSVANTIRVFGDDLIVPTDSLSVLVHLMTLVGLKVNESKTHSAGYFRESCGMDAFDGCNITPFYLKADLLTSTPRDIVSWIDQCNVAYDRGLWHLSDWMVSCIPSELRSMLPVCPRSPGGLYLRTTQSGCFFPRKGRWNTALQRVEAKQLVLKAKKRKGVRAGDQDLLHFFLGGDRREPTWNDPSRSSMWSWSTTMRIASRWEPCWV